MDMLTSEGVSILRQKFVDVDGVETQLGGNVRNAYMNDSTGREAVKDILPTEYYNAVLAVWDT